MTRGCTIEDQRTQPETASAAAQVLQRATNGRLGPWRLDSVLGRGTTGLVFRATAPEGSLRAVKVLGKTGEPVPSTLARFAREAAILQKLKVPGIVQIDGAMEAEDDLLYFAMELLEGADLEQRLARSGPMELAEAIDLCLEVLVPLEAAHRAGIVHRDLKPANIFLLDRPSNGSGIRLLDFGLAKEGVPVAETTAQSSRDLMMGTPSYMAPEQILGEPVSDATDIFGVASVLFVMLTGRRPWEGGAGLDLLVKKLQQPPPRLRTLRPDAPERLDALLCNAMSLRIDQRPHSAAAFASALRAVRGDLSGLGRATWPDLKPTNPGGTQSHPQLDCPVSGPEFPTIPTLASLSTRRLHLAGLAVLAFTALTLLAVWLSRHPPG